MRVIGTGGHVDHGKSTLVKAITGTHPDRLKEEQEREMTIDLGFAWFNLPVGEPPEEEEIGIVDVPGHRDFIENMLAGVGGIDAALFVVAADEGVMPQTREHLAILDLLEIQGGVVALTKIDTIEGGPEARSDWLDLVEEDLRQALAGSVLQDAPIIRVSGRTGEGVPELLQALSKCLADRPRRPNLNRPRLPVDRVFTISGFGTIVTGTLIDGNLQVGDEVEILPQRLRGRVRGLQTHKRKEDLAVPGSRTAVNISGVSVEEVLRGNVIAHPGDYRPTRRLDVHFRLLPDASTPVQHNMSVKLYLGAAEVVARLRLLGSEELLPGQEGWLQLEIPEPVVAVRGDHYILRRPSPGETLGGGAVVDPHPKGRHKRFSQAVIQRLETLAAGTPDEVLLQAIQALGAAPLREAVERSSLDSQAAADALEDLQAQGQLLALEEGLLSPQADVLVTSQVYWEQVSAQVQNELDRYHTAFPLRPGMPKEELRSRMKTLTRGSARLFNTLIRRLREESVLEEVGPLVKRPAHEIRFSPGQQQAVSELLGKFATSPYAPPTIKDSQAEAGEEVYAALVAQNRLVPVSSEVVFRREDYDQMVAEIRKVLENRGTITAAEVRDHFNTSRRYVLALLEHLDAIGFTVRQGDVRKLRK